MGITQCWNSSKHFYTPFTYIKSVITSKCSLGVRCERCDTECRQGSVWYCSSCITLVIFTLKWKNNNKTGPNKHGVSVDRIHLAQDKEILRDCCKHSNERLYSLTYGDRLINWLAFHEEFFPSRQSVPYSAKLHDFSRQLNTFLLHVWHNPNAFQSIRSKPNGTKYLRAARQEGLS